MAVGDVHWATLPDVNGHTQHGRRPVIVLQDDQYMGGLPTVLVVPLTTAKGASRYAGIVPVPATPQNGWTTNSFALVFQIRVTDRPVLEPRVGNIDAAVLAQLFAMLDRVTGRAAIPMGGNP